MKENVIKLGVHSEWERVMAALGKFQYVLKKYRFSSHLRLHSIKYYRK